MLPILLINANRDDGMWSNVHIPSSRFAFAIIFIIHIIYFLLFFRKFLSFTGDHKPRLMYRHSLMWSPGMCLFIVLISIMHYATMYLYVHIPNQIAIYLY